MGIHYRRKTDFFPEEDTTISYSGFEPKPTRLQAEGHSHHTSWEEDYSMRLIATEVPCGPSTVMRTL
ncbi:hypothetical protein TNCV_2670241 [Trichonephila clavipes]|nr:hypothetical protein TNCV_2670241 [Trichonephila clavipes]